MNNNFRKEITGYIEDEGYNQDEYADLIRALEVLKGEDNINEEIGCHIDINTEDTKEVYNDLEIHFGKFCEEKKSEDEVYHSYNHVLDNEKDIKDNGVYRININIKDDEEESDNLEEAIRSLNKKINEDDNRERYCKANDPINRKDKKTQLETDNTSEDNSFSIIHSSKEAFNKSEKDILNNLVNEINLSKVKNEKIKDERIYPSDLAVQIKRKNNLIISNNMIYIYEEEKGYYRELSNYEFQQFIRKRLTNEAKRKVNTSLLAETIRWFKTFEDIQKDINNDERYINFINGYYDLDTKEFCKTSRENLHFGYFINAKYKKRNVDGYNFKKYIQNVTKGNYQLELLVQEVMGVALSNIRGFKKAIFIIGSANTGKSTFLELLNNLIGNIFTSNLSLNDLNDKFRLAELANKRMNTCGEIAEIKLNRLDVFKSLTGNDIIMAERKGETPFNFKNTAMMLFSGNYLPKLSVTDMSNAFFKRMVIIPFNNAIPESEKDINLMDKLLKEKNHIVKFAMEGVLRFMENNYTFTNCKEAEDITKEYLYENASIQMFLEEECVLEIGSKVSSADLIDGYEEFCYEKQVNSMSEKALHMHIKNLPNVKRTRFRCQGENLYGYKGIRLRG